MPVLNQASNSMKPIFMLSIIGTYYFNNAVISSCVYVTWILLRLATACLAGCIPTCQGRPYDILSNFNHQAVHSITTHNPVISMNDGGEGKGSEKGGRHRR